MAVNQNDALLAMVGAQMFQGMVDDARRHRLRLRRDKLRLLDFNLYSSHQEYLLEQHRSHIMDLYEKQDKMNYERLKLKIMLRHEILDKKRVQAEVARINTQVCPRVRPPLAPAPSTARAQPTNSHTTSPSTRRRSA